MGPKLGRKIVADERLKTTRLILLTSSGHRGDGRQFAELGFAGYLLKPVAQRDLIDCLQIVLAANAEQWHSQTNRSSLDMTCGLGADGTGTVC